jgi:cytochrome b involved in lipid metabolism
MKRFLNFAIRLSLVNFLFFLFSIGFISHQKITATKQVGMTEKSQLSNPISNTPKSQRTSPVNKTPSQEQEIITPSPTVVQNLFSELSAHSTRGNCWITYSGHIYDITGFFGSHPGGDAIMLKYCGQDATAAFDSKDKSPAVAHSANAISLLRGYLVQ